MAKGVDMSDKKEGYELSFKEQMEGLIEGNMQNFPDAMAWVRKQLDRTDVTKIYTELELFQQALDGTSEWAGHPDPNEFGKVELIKWYRNKHGVGLKQAKDKCDQYMIIHYPVYTFSYRS